MKKLFAFSAMALAAAAFVASSPAYSCSTMVVGKAVSKTGTIIVGHNEDNDMRIVTSQYWVPAADHAAGETVTYEPGSAKIPQVAHTLGFYWTQTLHPAGYSYSDGFVNEKGVVVASNQSYQTYEDGEALKEGGVGYGIRRLIAERATSARDAVRVAADLVTRYGYRASGRIYTVADKDEAWQINLLHGGRYVAKKLKDNEVTYVSNAYTLMDVDLKSPDVIASPDLIEHAIATGHYKPAKAGDYSDFNFRVAYQKPERRSTHWVKDRSQRGWEIITGKEIADENAFPYSIVPKEKLGVADVKKVLSSHSRHESRKGLFHQGMNDICNPGTFESSVYVLADDPLLIKGWRTSGRPSESPYVPFYPLAKPALAQSFMDPAEATAQQFHGKPASFDYKADFAMYTFLDAQNYTELLGTQKKISEVKAKLDQHWNKYASHVHNEAKYLLKNFTREKAESYLHAYNVRAYEVATAAMRRYIASLPKVDVKINDAELSMTGAGKVTVTVLGTKNANVSKIAKSTATFGLMYPNGDVDVIAPAKALTMSVKDVNGDGIKDAIFTFDKAVLLKEGTPGIVQDIWFSAKLGDKKVAGFDTVRVVK